VEDEKEQKVKEAVLAAVQEDAGRKKLSCPDGLRIAQEHGVPPKLIGRICNKEKIKIRHCSLGCF
jgi:hypothetical protein